MILGVNTAKILQEASVLSIDEAYKDDDEKELLNELNSIGVLEDTHYTLQMVPLYPYKAIEESATKYIAYIHDINTYMESEELEIEDAISNICTENGIVANDLYVMIEGKKGLLGSVKDMPKDAKKKVLKTIKKVKKSGAKLLSKEGCKSEGCGSKKEGCNK